MSILKDINDEEHKLDMTPMIDVTFLLLIFFMCTLKFKTLEGKLAAYLPKDVGVNQSDAEPIEKVEILLKVIVEGRKMHPFDITKPWNEVKGTRFLYDDSRVVEFSIGPRTTRKLNVLQERLHQLHRADKERPATIDARKGIVYEDVVRVLDAAMNAEFAEVTFIGSYE
jgi:biopolymer transport protein ExbD